MNFGLRTVLVTLIAVAGCAPENYISHERIGSQAEPEFVLLPGYSRYTTTLAFSPDNTLLASAGLEGVKLWQVASGRLFINFEQARLVDSLAFSSDGSLLAAGTFSGRIYLWNLASRSLVHTFEEHFGSVDAVAFSTTGSLLASGSRDHIVRLWDVSTGKLLSALTGHTEGVNTLAFGQGDAVLASGSEDHSVRLWDLTSRKALLVLSGHTSSVIKVAFSTDGTKLISNGWDATKTWSVNSGRLLSSLPTGKGYALSSHGDILVAGDWPEMPAVWNLASSRRLFTLEPAPFSPAALSVDGSLLAYQNKDYGLSVIEVASVKTINTFGQAAAPVFALAPSPDGTLLALGTESAVQLWDTTSGKLLRAYDLEPRESSKGEVTAVVFSPDGHLLAAGGRTRAFKIWEVATGRLLQKFPTTICSAAFSSMGQVLATISSEGMRLQLWDVASGELLQTVKLGLDSCQTTIFSPDGKLLAYSNKRAIELREVLSGKLLRTFTGNAADWKTLAFSLDSSTLVAGAEDKVQVWDVASGSRVQELRGVGNPSVLAFSPNGRTLAVGIGKNVRLWDLVSGGTLRVLTGHSTPVASLFFSADGQRLVSGSHGLQLVGFQVAPSSGEIRYWNVRDGQLIAASHSFGLREFLTYTPQGYYLASPGAEGFAGWRIDGKVYGVEQYAERFHRPDLVALSLAGKPVPVPAVRLAVDRPPELRWLQPFEFTRSREVRLSLAYEGTTEIDDLVLVFNNKPLDLALPKPATRATIEVPLTLTSRSNQLLAFAFDKKRLKSRPLEVRFDFLDGAPDSIPQSAEEIIFAEGLPPEIASARSLQVNGKEVEVVSVDPERSSVQLLGADGKGGDSLLRQGTNWIETQAGQLRFWWEEKQLLRLPMPYAKSYAVVAAVDDYSRLKDSHFPSLHYMVAQAKELREALVQVGFPRENIVFLENGNATTERLNRELERFWQGGDRADADRLFVYFGGHGAGPDGQGYLVTSSFDPQRPTLTGFLMSDVVSRHFPNIQAKHLLVALDACAAGLAIPGVGIQSLGGTDEEHLRQFRKLTVVLGDTQQKARNLLVAGTKNQGALYVNGGIFTRVLIEALQGSGDLNRDGIIQFDELALQIRNQVRAVAAQNGFVQEPSSLFGDAWGHGRFLFFKPGGTPK